MESRILAEVSSGAKLRACAVWETRQCLVVPRRLARSPRYRLACRELEARGWPVLERITGGDTVPQGAGVLNVSLAFRMPRWSKVTLESVYRLLCAPIIAAACVNGGVAGLGSVGASFCDGRFNVRVGERKLAGTSQSWRGVRSIESGQAIFAHAVILFDADIEAGVEAVNAFASMMGEGSSASSDAHLNFRSIGEQFDALALAHYLESEVMKGVSHAQRRGFCRLRIPR